MAQEDLGQGELPGGELDDALSAVDAVDAGDEVVDTGGVVVVVVVELMVELVVDELVGDVARSSSTGRTGGGASETRFAGSQHEHGGGDRCHGEAGEQGEAAQVDTTMPAVAPSSMRDR